MDKEDKMHKMLDNSQKSTESFEIVKRISYIGLTSD